MKFLHIADLHLGKRLNDVPLLEDQKVVLRQITDIAREEKVDAVLIAGDVYQNAAPQGDAMEAFDSFITDLVAMDLKIFIISGNHDSAQRISYFSGLLKKSNVYVSEAFNGLIQEVELTDEFGPLHIHLLPFLKPIQVRRFYPHCRTNTYQEAMETVLKRSQPKKRERNVLLCHQFITNAEQSDSEEKSIGGLDNIDASCFDAYDYVALGHIHKPQKCLRETMRYSGSMMKYSLSEIDQKKSVSIVEMKGKGDISVHTVPLKAPHDVRKIEGKLDDIMLLPPSEDYVWVVVKDEDVPPDAKQALGVPFPHMVRFGIDNSKVKTNVDVLAQEDMENKTPLELFCDFYRLQNGDQPPSDKHIQVLNKIFKEMGETVK